MSQTPTFAGVPMRDQEVRFDVTPGEALSACRSQRLRLLDLARGLGPDEWTQQSRCAEWTVQHVVRHLVHTNRMELEAIAAARAGERFNGFAPDRFSPRTTPLDVMAAEGEQSVDATVAAFTTTTEQFLDELARMPENPEDLLVSSPVGRQPWHRAALHAHFDSGIHERDILMPLGRRSEASAEEVAVIAAYQVLVVGRILSLVGASLDLGLSLQRGPDLRVRVDGALASVERGNLDGAAIEARGDVEEVLDAMVGRGDLASVLEGPPEAVTALSAIAALV